MPALVDGSIRIGGALLLSPHILECPYIIFNYPNELLKMKKKVLTAC